MLNCTSAICRIKTWPTLKKVPSILATTCVACIDAVMLAQKDLVKVVYTLKQVVCVKG